VSASPTFDPWNPKFVAYPYDAYAELRAGPPVTFFAYLFSSSFSFDGLCVQPAARNGSSAIPVAATRSSLLP